MGQDIEIIYESDQLLIVNKPSGISVHNTEQKSNVLEILTPHYQHSLHLIHRLDRDTSGVLALAKNPIVAAAYMKEFETHRVTKRYEGVVCGRIDSDETLNWSQSITDEGEGRRDPRGPKKNHKEALTIVQVTKRSKFFTRCEFNLKTGRQHQIRKHCVINGHALIGDDRYGNPKYNQKIAKLYGVKRLALHCSELRFSTGEHFSASSPIEFCEFFND